MRLIFIGENLNICPIENSPTCLLSVKAKSKQETEYINPKKEEFENEDLKFSPRKGVKWKIFPIFFL